MNYWFVCVLVSGEGSCVGSLCGVGCFSIGCWYSWLVRVKLSFVWEEILWC